MWTRKKWRKVTDLRTGERSYIIVGRELTQEGGVLAAVVLGALAILAPFVYWAAIGALAGKIIALRMETPDAL